jgi:hypothetical protein
MIRDAVTPGREAIVRPKPRNAQVTAADLGTGLETRQGKEI